MLCLVYPFDSHSKGSTMSFVSKWNYNWDQKGVAHPRWPFFTVIRSLKREFAPRPEQPQEP
jgi:hypothetical protein